MGEGHPDLCRDRDNFYRHARTTGPRDSAALWSVLPTGHWLTDVRSWLACRALGVASALSRSTDDKRITVDAGKMPDGIHRAFCTQR